MERKQEGAIQNVDCLTDDDERGMSTMSML